MALADSIGKVYARISRPWVTLGIVVAADEAGVRSVTTSPTITSGTGAPSATEPNGSVYMRTNGTNGDDSLYMRIGGAWVALKCETA
jgi:hypothetical protein